MRHILMALTICVLASTPSIVLAQDHLPDKAGVAATLGKKEYSPYVGREFPTRVLWGDTHLHTMVSVDAGTMNRWRRRKRSLITRYSSCGPRAK